jgi:PPK2 family polyphosphate:nucleotide phosphotransferase
MKYRERFRVAPGSRVRLAEIDPAFTGPHEDKSDASEELESAARRLSDLQFLLYTEHGRSLLVCLQALDAAGKDGTVRHVFGSLDPLGARAYAFKVPDQREADHDFLWREHKRVPGKGEIVIFNRSHYEGVLVERVHDLVPKSVWSQRYQIINEFEKNLVSAGTAILKFYLHISENEQLKRFKRRLKDPTRQWKISQDDYTERSHFHEYWAAYEEMLEKTSTDYAPWFVIPANRKWFRNLAVSQVVVETLEAFGMHFPPPTVDLDKIREEYRKAKRGVRDQ